MHNFYKATSYTNCFMAKVEHKMNYFCAPQSEPKAANSDLTVVATL